MRMPRPLRPIRTRRRWLNAEHLLAAAVILPWAVALVGGAAYLAGWLP